MNKDKGSFAEFLAALFSRADALIELNKSNIKEVAASIMAKIKEQEDERIGIKSSK